MSEIEYLNIKAYQVTRRLQGKPITETDPMAERLPCAGCGAPVGYFCLGYNGPNDANAMPSRFACKGIIGSQNPRTMVAFAKAAEEIERAKK